MFMSPALCLTPPGSLLLSFEVSSSSSSCYLIVVQAAQCSLARAVLLRSHTRTSRFPTLSPAQGPRCCTWTALNPHLLPTLAQGRRCSAWNALNPPLSPPAARRSCACPTAATQVWTPSWLSGRLGRAPPHGLRPAAGGRGCRSRSMHEAQSKRCGPCRRGWGEFSLLLRLELVASVHLLPP